tara:strand:+ start:352 stop:663 length:312 start_codon:yes stop_codon:yes gene_type:complete
MTVTKYARLTVLTIGNEEFDRGLVGRVLENAGNGMVVGAVKSVYIRAMLETFDLATSDIEMPENFDYKFLSSAHIRTTNAFVVKPPEAETLNNYIQRTVSFSL